MDNSQATTMEPLAPGSPPGVKEIRDQIPPADRDRSTVKGLGIFIAALAFYLCTFYAVAALNSLLLKIAASMACGIGVGMLFVIGHDACHGSLTAVPWLNRLVGRLCFLPSYHPVAAWEHSHNGLHHAWTNVRGKDPVYAPFPKREFDALPPYRRLLERVYRSRCAVGLGLLYLLEIYFPLELFPGREDGPKGARRSTFEWDRMLVISFFVAQVAVLALIGAAGTAGMPALLLLIVLGCLVPFAVFIWIMGFVTFLHHTHPRVPWYADERDWSFYGAQVRGVVHVEMPWIIEMILHNILHHTAHHVDPRVPLYSLPSSQRKLESAYGHHITVERWTLRGFLRTLRTCKLYDYEHHRWLDFDGRPTGEALFVQERNVPGV